MAALNDMVRHQNASEDKKLVFKLSQLENLKSTYSRQKEKELMYFAIQQMRVPVRTDPVIFKFRKEMEEQGEEYEHQIDGGGGTGRMKKKLMGSRMDSLPGLGTSRRHNIPRKRGEVLKYAAVGVIRTDSDSDRTYALKTFEEVVKDEEEEEEGTFFTAIDSSVDQNNKISQVKTSNNKAFWKQTSNHVVTTEEPANIQFSRRIVSPHPRQRKNNSNMYKNSENTAKKKSISDETESTEKIRSSKTMISDSRNIKERKMSTKTQTKKSLAATKLLSQRNTNEMKPTKPSKSKEKVAKPKFCKPIHGERKVCRRFSWNKCVSPQSIHGHKYTAPRLSDLPPLGINIYEVPCNEKEARENWKNIMESIRDSFVRDERSENEISRSNHEIQLEWQARYKEMKKNRKVAATGDDLKLRQGEQLTLVKFLPKSRQHQFIKEKFLYR